MKSKLFLVLAVVFISNTILIAQKSDEVRAKEVIKLVWSYYMAWDMSCRYFQPQEYIKDESSQRTIGQKFLNFPKTEKYAKMELVWTDNTISQVKFENNTIFLTWNNDKITQLRTQYLAGFNCTINYNEKGELEGILGEVFPNKKLKGRYLTTFDFVDQRISKITKYICNTSGKNAKVNKIQTFEYNNNETIVSSISYKFGKDPKPENVADNSKAIYKKEGNLYIKIGPYADNHECDYNELDLLANDKRTEGLKIDRCKYEYIDGKLSKEEIVKTDNNEFIEKDINIYIVNPNLPASAQEYEKVKGLYKFNKQGELIYEANGAKYRKKENGIWGDWKFFQY